ncbi:hypothetical protein A1F94_012129 [Pyrenophora tritici-repentis]|nr:hypothetical protein A1F94_012129 [Pyrenophora tritici-repentis]
MSQDQPNKAQNTEQPQESAPQRPGNLTTERRQQTNASARPPKSATKPLSCTKYSEV